MFLSCCCSASDQVAREHCSILLIRVVGSLHLQLVLLFFNDPLRRNILWTAAPLHANRSCASDAETQSSLVAVSIVTRSIRYMDSSSLSREPFRRITRSRSKKAQICHLDSLSKETLDMVLEHLKPPVSTRPFKVMERGLPRNDFHETTQWHTIAIGMAALACLARTAHRYHAAVIPHLYQNLVMPSHAYGRGTWDPSDPKFFSKLED